MKESLRKFVSVFNNMKIEDYISDRSRDIYHYTSPSGLASIIQNGTLRFTDRLFLNDKTEGIYVLHLCMEILEEKNLHLNEDFRRSLLEMLRAVTYDFSAYCLENKLNIYQCSFSCDGDSLCLWNYYTKGDSIKGYNLHFEAKALCQGLKLNRIKTDGKPLRPLRGRVVYDKKKQTRIVTGVVQFFNELYKTSGIEISTLTKYLIDKLLFTGVFFKDSCFAIENEYRIVLPLYVNDDGTYMSLEDQPHHYEKNGILVPYIDLEFPKECLLSIGLSPTVDDEMAVKSILRVGAKYENLRDRANIVKSVIPVRY